MKILVIGNFSSAYVEQSWGAPLRKRRNTQVVDIIPLLSQGFQHGESAEGYVLSLLRQGDFDLFFFYSDGIQTLFPESFFDAVRAIRVPILTFHADDEPEKQFELNSRHDARFDIIASCSARAHARRARASSSHSLYLPWGFNPDNFYPVPTSGYDYDLVFIGKHKVGGKNAPTNEDGIERQQILVELKEFADRAGIRFAVFGMDWDQHPILKEVDGGALNHDEMLSVYGRSKLVFNPGWSFDSGVHNYQIKLRHFEVAGCRACQITNHNPELAELFRPNEEVLFYRDLESLKDTILHYLQADETREAIAEAGYLRALREHTMGHRLDDLFEECARLFPPSASPLQTTPQVIRVIVGACAPGNPHARDCLQIERMDDLFRPDIAEQLPNGGYVHLISGTILPLIRTTDYGSVLPMLARCKAPITHCDSLLRLPPLGKNPVQVDRGNFNGSTLNQARSLGLPPSIGAYFEEMVISGRNYFQINLLFAAHLFKSAAPDPLDSLDRNDIYESQRLICDLDIPQRGPAFKTCLNQRLADAFCAIEQLELKYVVWGAAGEMSIILPCWIDDHPSGFLGYLDRSLAGQSKGGHIIHSPERLDELQPDLVFIAATISGPTIFESMRDQRARYLLLPLYDLNHRNWFCGFS